MISFKKFIKNNNKIYNYEEYSFIGYDDDDNILNEESKASETAKKTAHAGHAAELTFGAHLQNNLNKIINPNGQNRPIHMLKFRDNDGKTPEQVLKEKYEMLGKKTADKINDDTNVGAQKVSKEFLDRLKKINPKIHKKVISGEMKPEVVWTSKKNDHEAYTGVPDKAHIGESDVMVGIKDGEGNLHHVEGHSLKYASGEIKLGSMSAATIERVAKMKNESIQQHHEEFNNKVDDTFEEMKKEHDNVNGKGSFELKYGKHNTAKRKKEIFRDLDKDRTNTFTNKYADELIAHQRHRDTNAAKELAVHFSNMSHEERNKNFINLVAPEHTHKVFHTIIHPGGETKSLDFHEELKNHLKEKRTKIEHSSKSIHLVDDEPTSPTYGRRLLSLEHGDRRGIDDSGVATNAKIHSHLVEHLYKSKK